MNNCKICIHHEWYTTKNFETKKSYCILRDEPVDIQKTDTIAENCKDFEEENFFSWKKWK